MGSLPARVASLETSLETLRAAAVSADAEQRAAASASARQAGGAGGASDMREGDSEGAMSRVL